VEKGLFNHSEDQELSNSMRILAQSLSKTEIPKNYKSNEVYTKNKQKHFPQLWWKFWMCCIPLMWQQHLLKRVKA